MATEAPRCTVTGFGNIKDRDNGVRYIRLSHERDQGKATIAVGFVARSHRQSSGISRVPSPSGSTIMSGWVSCPSIGPERCENRNLRTWRAISRLTSPILRKPKI